MNEDFGLDIGGCDYLMSNDLTHINASRARRS